MRLKKRDTGGSWAIFDVNDFIGSAVDAGSALRFHKGSSSWLLDGNFSYRNNSKTYDTSYKKYLAPQLPVSIYDNSHSPFNYRTANASLQYSYVPSASFLLSAKYSFTLYNSLRKSFSDYTEDLAGITDDYTGYSRTHSNSPTHRLNVYLSKELNTCNTIDINLVAGASKNDYESQYEYYRSAGTLRYLNDIRSERYSLLGGVNYSHIFTDQSRLGLCYLITFSANTNRYPETDTRSRLKELHNQVFLEYRKTFGQRLSLYLKTGINNQHFSIDRRSSNFLSNLSRINLQWIISQSWSLTAEGAYQGRPLTLGQLDDHQVQTSEYLYHNGNPALRNAHEVSASVQPFFMRNNFSAYAQAAYMKIFNPALSFIRYDESLSAYLSAPVNAKYVDGISASVGASVQNLWNMFTIGGRIQYGHNRLAGVQGWRNHHNSISGYIVLSWVYRKWQVDYYRMFPMSGMDGYVIKQQGEKYDQLAVTFRPMPKLSLQLAWCYMFEKRGWRYWEAEFAPEYEYHRDREIRNDANWIRFTCNYTLDFGNPFRKSVRQKVLDLQDNGKSFNDYGK